jgi:hypothetical protein
MTIFDLLDILSPLRGMPAVIIMLVSAFTAVALRNMRLTIPALSVHYLIAGLLLVDLLDARLAVAYTVSGLFVIMILFITAWQIDWGRPPSGFTPEEIAETAPPPVIIGRFSLDRQWAVRIMLSVATLLVTLLVTPIQDGTLSVFSPETPYLSTAVIGLGLLGLVGMGTLTEPLPAGIGLLLFITGFVIYYSALDASITMVIALISLMFLSALAIAYLAQARYLPMDSPV